MRAQTPSYVVSVKLHLPEPIENRLEKSFHISNSVYNEGISLGLKRFEALKRNPCVFNICLPSCETSNAQTHTEIGSLPEAGHCYQAVAFDLSLNRRRELSAFTIR